MSGKLNLALAVIAYQQGNKDDCLSYMAKAGEFGDDLTQFVSEVMKPAPTAVRNDGSTPQAENTIAPSLAAVAASDDFINLTRRLSRQMALASVLDEGDELEEDLVDDEEDDFILDDEPEGLDEDLDEGDLEEDDEEEVDEDEESVASADVPTGIGPIRYKC